MKISMCLFDVQKLSLFLGKKNAIFLVLNTFYSPKIRREKRLHELPKAVHSPKAY